MLSSISELAAECSFLAAAAAAATEVDGGAANATPRVPLREAAGLRPIPSGSASAIFTHPFKRSFRRMWRERKSGRARERKDINATIFAQVPLLPSSPYTPFVLSLLALHFPEHSSSVHPRYTIPAPPHPQMMLRLAQRTVQRTLANATNARFFSR
jgi:hypothetical protein